MDSSLILSNALNSLVLFFCLGLTAVFLKSALAMPQLIPQLFSSYLFFAISVQGNHAPPASGLSSDIALVLTVAVVLAAVAPIYSFFILCLNRSLYNAVETAAAFNLLSAVPFVTVSLFLSRVHVDVEEPGKITLALMVSPAIIVNLALVRVFANWRTTKNHPKELVWGEVLQESCLNRSVFLLADSVLMRWFISGRDSRQPAYATLRPTGLLCEQPCG